MEEKKLPTAFQMIKTFSKELTTFVKEGMPNVSEEDYQERIDTCFKCEHFLEKLNRCGVCGCLVEYKARWKTTKCPDDPPRWKQQIVGEGGKKLNIKIGEQKPKTDNPKTSDEV